MKRTSIKIFVFSSVIIMALASRAFAAFQWNEEHTVAFFYPSNMTYVDRSDPKTDFGSDPFLKVGDAIGNPIPDSIYYDAVNATRTYLKFNQQELAAELANYTIVSASLNMYLSGVENLPGSSPFDLINVLQVTGANSYSYMQNLTWDRQKERNVTFSGGMMFASLNFNVTGETPGLRTWENASSGNGTVTDMVQMWLNEPATNYGVVISNEIDGNWTELVNGTVYQIQRPGQMNELEATFAKSTGYYPFLKVQVVPEPVSSVLMIVGAGVLGIASSRRRKKIS
ncbi:MAG TPA: DNRLRE domain-containing protein [Candidatus Omnitrophota bacterium]|nr:DNRLRE domain-containing protein [Candidatus Omnitrophota bacterium]HQJ15842.1 DNRLRE domain-containing protein [Candidatus Omnitrophota bacterium]